jgi:ubiquitin-protein ligase
LIFQEFADCSSSPPDGISVKLVDESSLYKWDITVEGPSGSAYQVSPPCFPNSSSCQTNTSIKGGTFHLNLSFPLEYPFKPPVVSFTTKIYHPNVTNDDKGSMCLGMLRPDQWKPPNKVAAVLLLVRQLLVEPDTDNAVEAQIADQYKNNRREFEKNAKDWVKRYAGKK